jgi:hypothetical protein
MHQNESSNRLTEMEVVVLCVAEGNEEANGVNKRCFKSVYRITSVHDPVQQASKPGYGAVMRVYARLPDGFLPMYFFA